MVSYSTILQLPSQTTLADDFLADLQGDDGLDTAVKMEEENVQEFQVSSSSSLLHSPALQQVLSVCTTFFTTHFFKEIPKYEKKSGYSGNWFQFTETKDPEYDLIVEANDMAGKLEIEIRMIHGVRSSFLRLLAFLFSHCAVFKGPVPEEVSRVGTPSPSPS